MEAFTQSTNLPSERTHHLQCFQILTTLSPEPPRTVITAPSIATSLTMHQELALPHKTKHSPKPAALRAMDLKEMPRLDTGTQQNTMPTIPSHALPKPKRALMQSPRSAGIKTSGRSISSRSLLRRTRHNGRLDTHRRQGNTVSGLKARRRVFLQVTWLDMRWSLL